ncbi:MAG TPA: YdcF family protein [Campylobacterales bacterium]|nr:YdcF family protein [Campylobacterales bacterium]
MSASFIAAQVFHHLFLSPLLFVLLFFISAFFVSRAKWLFVGAAILFYILSTGLAAKSLLWPLEDAFRTHQKIDFKPDAVIVLGGGANAYVPDSKLISPAYKRFVQGMTLAKKMDVPLVFAGGGWIDRSGISEAAAAIESANVIADAYDFARPSTTTLNGGFGLLVEDKSENTLQNAKNTIELMKLNGISIPKVVLVTSASHMKRAKVIFEKNGFRVTPYAVDFITGKFNISYLDFLPSFGSLENSYTALKEYIGIVKFFFVDNGDKK